MGWQRIRRVVGLSLSAPCENLPTENSRKYHRTAKGEKCLRMGVENEYHTGVCEIV